MAAEEEVGRLSATELAHLLTDWNKGVVVVDPLQQRPTLEGSIPLDDDFGSAHWSTPPDDVVMIIEPTPLDRPQLEVERYWLARLKDASWRVWVTWRDPEGWLQEHLRLADPIEPQRTGQDFSFTIPRGICELNEPAMELGPEHFKGR